MKNMINVRILGMGIHIMAISCLIYMLVKTKHFYVIVNIVYIY